ncbi:class I SAM-dependent methyltransferase [Nitrosospira multiformis]|nr:class I SAM-dependent methyltransferase [Nitrosospira multiformis]
MDDPQKVAAYVEAGRENGVMAPVYMFHAANICEVIRAGDVVVDLACGPANQLVMVARLNPDAHFIGVDMSSPMLEQAKELISRHGLNNVDLRHGDITDLSVFAGNSVDVVVSTMALHHLPNVVALKRTYSEVARVLKPEGGIYMVDFGHLKSGRSIDYFAHQYADRQPELFTLDYLNSLHAAFYLEDIRQAAHSLFKQARLYSTFLMPFMVALKSPARRGPDMALAIKFAAMKRSLPSWHQKDLADLKTFFRMGGLSCALLG